MLKVNGKPTIEERNRHMNKLKKKNKEKLDKLFGRNKMTEKRLVEEIKKYEAVQKGHLTEEGRAYMKGLRDAHLLLMRNKEEE